MRIETQRLQLRALLPRELELWTEDIAAFERELDVFYRAEALTGDFFNIVKGQCSAVRADSANYMWRSFWLLIRREDRVVVGSADFKDVPDVSGAVEIGYGLGPAFEKNGYMTEAVAAMCTWALRQQGVSAVVAETEMWNAASERVLQRCGFHITRTERTRWWRLER